MVATHSASEMAMERTVQPEADEPAIGGFRRFGEHGPAYEVVGRQDPETLRIVVVESREELSYPVSDARADPEA